MQEIQLLLQRLKNREETPDHFDFDEYFIKELVQQLQDATIIAKRKIAILEFWFTPTIEYNGLNFSPSLDDSTPFTKAKLDAARSYSWIRNIYYSQVIL